MFNLPPPLASERLFVSVINYLSYYGYNWKMWTNYITLCDMLSLFGLACIHLSHYLWLFSGNWNDVGTGDERLIGGKLEQSVRIVPVHEWDVDGRCGRIDAGSTGWRRTDQTVVRSNGDETHSERGREAWRLIRHDSHRETLQQFAQHALGRQNFWSCWYSMYTKKKRHKKGTRNYSRLIFSFVTVKNRIIFYTVSV